MIEWLLEFFRELIENKFTGSVKVNFFKGGISNLNKEESIKPPHDN